jgi:hypothetical protein
MFDEFFNTRESNENETCKKFDIEEVNSEAGSTRDLLIEVCPDNIDTAKVVFNIDWTTLLRTNGDGNL